MYYNSLRVINDEFSQHASMSCHLILHHLSSLNNNSKNSRFFFKCMAIHMHMKVELAGI
jgi:hypothetical protein